MASGPLVTVITPTIRPEMLPKAVESFQQQTYPGKEMVILDNGDEPSPIPDDPRIRYIRCRPMTTGALRNLACQLAYGEIICHFDDDDLSAPQRIERQMAQLLDSGKQVVGYDELPLLLLPQREVIWYRCKGRPVGATLMYFSAWQHKHPFLDLRDGEDYCFAREAFLANELAAFPADGMLLWRRHGGNTSQIESSPYIYEEESGKRVFVSWQPSLR